MTTTPGKSVNNFRPVRIVKFIFPILLLAVCFGSVSAQKWVNLTAFKDQTFQTYLKTAYESSLSADKTQINVLNVENVAINSEAYRAITTLEGIKELVNLKYLFLPGCTNSNYAFSLKTIDVSGLKHLEIISSSYFVSVKSSVDGNNHYKTNASGSSNNNVTTALESLIAENCPALKYVGVGGSKYTKFKTFSFEGSTNIEALYIGSPVMKKVDISGLPKVVNLLRVTATTGKYYTTSSGLNKSPNFGMASCEALEEVIVGDRPDIQLFAINQCTNVKKLDISGLTGLTEFGYTGYSFSSATTTEPPRGIGGLHTLKMADEYPNMKYFTLYQTSLRHFDPAPIANTVTSFVLRGSYVQEFDVKALKKAVGIDISFNCLHKIDLPYLTSCKDFWFKYNRATYLPYPGNTHTKLATTSNGDYQEQVVNVGPVMKYKIFDDPSFVQYVMFEEGGGTSTKRNYYAPYGGHIGVEANGEDPCYFYFDDPYVTGSYFFYFPNTNKLASVSYVKVTLSRNYPDDNDYNFYLSGDFNNWEPEHDHRFVLTDPANGIFKLAMKDTTVSQHFRVWDNPTEDKVKTNWGGHDTDKYASNEGDGGDHIYVKPDYEYTLGTNPDVHYTTFPQPGVLHNHHVDPTYELRYVPEADNNYLKLYGNVITGVESIVADGAGAGDGAVEYYNLQGVRLSNPTPGQLVIRRQGNSVSKVLVR